MKLCKDPCYTVASATFVVAASDSLHRERADYVCDGVDDQVEIQAAIDALPSGGGEIVLLEGTFEGRFAIDKANVILEGQGMNSTILKLPDHVDVQAQTLTIAADYVTVRNLQVDGNRDNQTIPGGETWAYSDGIAGYGDFITIEHCYVHDSMTHGIIFWSNATSSHSNAVRATRDYVTNNSVLFNRVENVGNPAYSSGSIDSAYHTHFFKIIGNYVKGDGVYSCGIHYHGGRNDIISNNIVEDTICTGIYINEGRNILISGNMIKNCAPGAAKAAIRADNTSKRIVITDNVIENTINGRGIVFNGTPSNHLEDIIIANNMLTGISESGIRSAYTTDYQIINNIVSFGRGGDGYGIIIGTESSKVTVVGNVIKHDVGGYYGVDVSTGVTGCIIKNNHITPRPTYDAIHLVEPTDVIFSEQYSDLFMDALAASATHVHAAITGTGAEQEITTAITNPDIPRNISITNSANSTGDVKIDGVDAKGNTVSDTIAILTGGIAYGVVAFATVSKITIPAGVANPDTITVGISDKLGLSNIIYVSGDVYKVKVNNADDPTIGTVNTTYDTVDCGGINAGDDITIWYKSNLNLIS